MTRIGFAGGRLFVAGQTDPGSVGLELSTIDGSGETERLLPVPDGEIRDLVARDDGLYVAGETLTVAGETWSQDAAIAKYDLTTTNPIWSFVVGGPWGNERVSSITVGDAGVVYAAGQFNSDATADGMPLVTVGGLDFFLARLVEGVPEWVHTWGSPDNDGDGPRVALMPDGGVVAVSHLGFPQNQLDFRRFTSSGELLWNRVLPIGASLFAVGVGAGGAITAGGTFSGVVLDLEPLGGPRLCSLGEFTAFVIGLDDDGRHVWSRAFASPIGGGSNVIRLLSHGDQVVVTGYVGMTDSNAERADYGYVRCFDSQGNPGGTFVLTNHPYADLALGDSGELFAGATQRFAGPSAPAPLHVWALPAISE